MSNNYNSGIARIKGFAIHLPISLEETNRYIADTLPSIETLSIIINGLPTKSQIICSSLVDLDKVTQALLWQKLNNRLYDNLTINNIDQPSFDQLRNVDPASVSIFFEHKQRAFSTIF